MLNIPTQVGTVRGLETACRVDDLIAALRQIALHDHDACDPRAVKEAMARIARGALAKAGVRPL